MSPNSLHSIKSYTFSGNYKYSPGVANSKEIPMMSKNRKVHKCHIKQFLNNDFSTRIKNDNIIKNVDIAGSVLISTLRVINWRSDILSPCCILLCIYSYPLSRQKTLKLRDFNRDLFTLTPYSYQQSFTSIIDSDDRS